MNPADELALLKRHVRRIEADLTLANRQLADLERRLAAQGDAVVEPAVQAITTSLPPPLPPAIPVRAPDVVAPVPSPITAPESSWRPRAASEFAPAATIAPSGPSPLRVWLTSLQLWPPAGEGDAEIRLGAWWATRIGAMLAVIGIVLFGVYVSVNTRPWVKFAELLAVSLAVTGAGLWWERKIPRFGAVVFAAGLALLYFCAFAGYALPAVKVIDRTVTAAIWQLGAIGILGAIAVLRGSANIATMAVGFGYVTAVFSQTGELHAFALCTATLLGVAAVGFHRLLRWEAPSVVAMPGCYAVYALVVLGTPGDRGAGAGAWWLWGVLLVTAFLFFARDWRSLPRESAVSWGERWFQGLNSGLALLVGVAVALSFFRVQLAWFYIGSAVVLAVLAALRRRQAVDDPVRIILLTKAAGALALAIVEMADGHTAALALLIQAWVVFLTAARLQSRSLSVAAGIVASVAYAFFVISFDGQVAAASPDAAGMVLFVTGFAWFATEAARRLVADLERRLIEIMAGVSSFIAAWLSIQAWEPAAWIASWAVVVASALGAVGVLRRSSGSALASGALVIGAHLLVWYLAASTSRSPALPGNAAVVAGVSLALGLWLAGNGAGRLSPAWRRPARIAWVIFWALSVGTMAVAVFEVCLSPLVALVWVLGIAWVLAALSPVFTERHLPWFSVGMVAVALVLWAGRGLAANDRGVMVLALAMAWVLPFSLAGIARYRECVLAERRGALIEPLLVAAATIVTYRLLPWTIDPAWRTPLFAATALVIGLAGQRFRLHAAIPASWIIWLMVGIASLSGLAPEPASTQRLFMVFAAVMVWIPVLRFAKAGQAEDKRSWISSSAVAVQVAVASALGAWLAAFGWRDAGQVLAIMGVASLAWVAQRFTGLPAARVATVVLLGAAWGRAVVLAFFGGAEGPGGVGFAAVLAVCLAMAAMPWLTRRTGALANEEEWQKLAWVAGSAALGLAFLVALSQRGALAPYATVGWGVGAILLFVTGLFVRVRPYRLLGLAGLLVCIPRVFLVDLQSAFHRIIAFVVLGVVLLWVGFSYHRFRHLILDTKEEP